MCARGYGLVNSTDTVCQRCPLGTASPGGNISTPHPVCIACGPGSLGVWEGATECAPTGAFAACLRMPYVVCNGLCTVCVYAHACCAEEERGAHVHVLCVRATVAAGCTFVFAP